MRQGQFFTQIRTGGEFLTHPYITIYNYNDIYNSTVYQCRWLQVAAVMCCSPAAMCLQPCSIVIDWCSPAAAANYTVPAACGCSSVTVEAGVSAIPSVLCVLQLFRATPVVAMMMMSSAGGW